jgi:hypothetical protein
MRIVNVEKRLTAQWWLQCTTSEVSVTKRVIYLATMV